MDVKSVIRVQKKGIVMHRLVYLVFFLQRLLLYFESGNILFRNLIAVLVFLGFCEILEEICFSRNYFDSIAVVRIVRYIQCMCATIMFIFMEGADDSGLTMIALLIMFMVDFFLSMGVVDKEKTIFYFVGVAGPVIAVLIIKLAFNTTSEWIFLLLDLLMILFVLAQEAYSIVEYMSEKEKKILNQRNEFTEIMEKNENILHMQDKLKNTNIQLNIQKLDLQNANKKIQEANEEMLAQAGILHFIASSFEVPKISNQITDAIMQVKKLGFCAVYIIKGAYLNKHANYVIKTNIGQLQGKIRECMEDIYLEMTAKGKKEEVYHENLTEDFPFLRDVNIHSVYIKVLGLGEETYGLFMIGDSQKQLFSENMSFYDAIIAQYDIAISNAKIYNEMQNMARKDGLTGINNRTYFMELFRSAVSRIQKGNGCMSVALFDIDKFKSVNDTYGHLAGDEVIKRIASVAEECIDKYNGFVCRYGGEEFVAVLPERKLELAQSIIEELFEEICAQVVRYNEYDITMSVSVGLTAYPEVCTDPEELLKRADWCMYYAKEHGRHQIKVDDGSVQRD
ncbi:MAG: GGDEF domain-containing protein [Bacteroidales bacterium]|nr:GGDEF domain-containing protein [Clostridium sp.]MCM1203076.1 GGDEF domain-containing protein [Bacteroidales bacterium]